MQKPVLILDGSEFRDLNGFFDDVSRSLIPGAAWGRGLDSFNDILRGGFGTPEGGFVLRWLHSDKSRADLGYAETVRYIENKLRRCHPSNVPFVRAELESAARREGPTLFDTIVSIIREHGPGGSESQDAVDLELA